jgi:galactose mutarotase-like enzyme
MEKATTICSADGRTEASFIPEKGGICCSIIMPHGKTDRELLFLPDDFWQIDNHELAGGLSFLFPICGNLERMGVEGNYLHDGNIYHLPTHGFSWNMPWKVINAASDTVILELTDTKDTLVMYPFSFKIQLIYKISDAKLTCEQVYTNIGTEPMVYYAGFQPYFLTPAHDEGKEQVILNFRPKRLFRYNDQFTDLIGEKKPFEVPISIADHSMNEQLAEVDENSIVHLKYPNGFNLYMKTCELFRYQQKSTVPQKPFICIEPWMGFPNALNTAIGSRWLMPGERETGCLELWSGDNPQQNLA